MDIYLTNLTNKDRLRFPMLPTEVRIKTANQFAAYTILSVGEVRLPSGTSLDSISWSGILPGQKRTNGRTPYIFDWQDPKAIYRWIEQLKTQSGTPVKARLLITESPINCDVYLSDFTGTLAGGYGDINYSISLMQAKDIRISTSKTGKEAKTASPQRPSPPAAKTYTVKKGDSLWKIAQRYYGKGSDYTKIYQANGKVIGNNPNLIYPGQVLAIPG